MNQASEETFSNQQLQQIPLKELFRYSDQKDAILIVIGTFFSVLMGAAIPVFAYLTGDMIDAFIDPNKVQGQAKKTFYAYISLGFAALITASIMFSGWTISGERQAIKCRKQLFKSLMKQEIGWFDTNQQSQMYSKYSADAFSFQQAVGEKISTLIMLVSTFLSGIGISFYLGWQLALVILGYLPLIIVLWSINIKVKKKSLEKQDQIYLKLDGKALQTLSAIRLVKQMNAEEFQTSVNDKLLEQVGQEYFNTTLQYVGAASIAILSLYLGFALCFWFGSQCIFKSDKCPQRLTNIEYTAGNSVKIFYSLFLPAISLNQLTPSFLKIKQGKIAAAKLFALIDRLPLIRSKQKATIPENCFGVIKFQNVCFAYPKDKKTKILVNCNFQMNCQHSAIVGVSGCGKSTIFQLIMRYYDPDSGTIYLDGVDLREINLEWLRSQIGYVGQEPVLFATTIKQNMVLGKENVSEEQIYDALRKAEAQNFVIELKDKLQTFVGNGGSQISGGQKQRIAIARALLKKPKILLFDEATSALDRRNEQEILKTLRLLGKDYITISITHRKQLLRQCQKVYHFSSKQISNITTNQAESIENFEKEMKTIQNKKNLIFHLHVPSEMKQEEKFQAQLYSRNKQNNQSLTQVALLNNLEEQKQTENNGEFSRIWWYMKQRKCLFLFGSVMALIQGLVFPTAGVLLSKIVASQIKYTRDTDFYSSEVRRYLYYLVILGFGGAIIGPTMHFIFSSLGSSSIKNLRSTAYKKIIRMPIEWLEKQENLPQILISKLSDGCKVLYNFLQLYLPHCTVMCINIIYCIIGASIFEWRTGLTSIGLIPLIILSQAIQFAYIRGLSQSKGKIFDQSSIIINEKIMNIRTVLSLGNPDYVQKIYQLKLDDILKALTKKCLFSGFMFGLSYFLQYLCFALMFLLTAVYSSKFNLDVSQVLSAMFLVIFAAISAGNQTNFMQDISKAKLGAKNMFQLVDLQDQFQRRQKIGCRNLKIPIKGNIVFRNVSFSYKNRDVNALNKVSFDVKAGEKVGIVGQSGCGKSTILNLLLGFYYPTQGQIFLQNTPINDYDLAYLRQAFGVVSQEPILFDQTIKWNIKYNLVETSEQSIIKASQEANFNPNLENQNQAQRIRFQLAQDNQDNQRKADGFDKRVGPKGSHVSGGQKQRIAIARAILRKPLILLLDEVTSALDPENELKVQASLDRLMNEKTTINITHRLETIGNADKIVVLNRGQIESIGKFQDLVKSSKYFNLIRGSSYK